MQIRRLGPDDAEVLGRIAEAGAAFDLDDREAEEAEDEEGDAASARALLADPTVLFWVAFDDEAAPVGMLHCQTIRKHAARPVELLLYDVGVHVRARRHGVGRALVDTMTTWMKEHDVEEVWVLADNAGAVAFYEACGFAVGDQKHAVYMTREL